jgi:hypothetical protein
MGLEFVDAVFDCPKYCSLTAGHPSIVVPSALVKLGISTFIDETGVAVFGNTAIHSFLNLHFL